MLHRNQPRKNAQQGAVVCVWHSVCWERVSQTSDSPWTQRPAKLRETRWLKGEQSGGGDDGHLRATVVTDTHLLDFIFLVRETFRLTDEGRRRLFLTSLRLNSKSGCGSEGIHNLHPLSDWSSDYYVRWRQLKVTKLGFISPCLCVCLPVRQVSLRLVLKVNAPTVKGYNWNVSPAVRSWGRGDACSATCSGMVSSGASAAADGCRPGSSKCIPQPSIHVNIRLYSNHTHHISVMFKSCK